MQTNRGQNRLEKTRDLFKKIRDTKGTFHASSVQSLSHGQLFANPWTAAQQASRSITNSQSLLRLMSIELVMPSNHLVLCHPLLLLPSISPSIRVFSNASLGKHFSCYFGVGRGLALMNWHFPLLSFCPCLSSVRNVASLQIPRPPVFEKHGFTKASRWL